MTILRNSPAHIAEVIAIDTRFNREVRELQLAFLADRPGMHKDMLAYDREWMAVTDALEAKRQEALAELRGQLVDEDAGL